MSVRASKTLLVLWLFVLITTQAFLFYGGKHFVVGGIISAVLGSRCVVWGVTGGVGSGKSTVAKILESNGWIVIDADSISRNVLRRGSLGFLLSVCVFGRKIIDRSTGDIDRQYVRQIVFDDPWKRRLLNAITHPQIIITILWQIVWFRILKMCSKVLLDAPLLFECHLDIICGPVIVVSTTEDIQLQRLQARDIQSSASTLKKMICSQLPLDTKVSMADIVIENNSTVSDLFNQVAQRLLHN